MVPLEVEAYFEVKMVMFVSMSEEYAMSLYAKVSNDGCRQRRRDSVRAAG